MNSLTEQRQVDDDKMVERQAARRCIQIILEHCRTCDGSGLQDDCGRTVKCERCSPAVMAIYKKFHLGVGE